MFAVGSNNRYIDVFGVLEQKYASLGASGSRPSSVLFRYRLNRYHDGRRTAPPGTGLKLVLHRPHQYVRVPYCSMHVLVESLLGSWKYSTSIVHELRLRMLAIFKWVNVLWSVSKGALVRINIGHPAPY